MEKPVKKLDLQFIKTAFMPFLDDLGNKMIEIQKELDIVDEKTDGSPLTAADTLSNKCIKKFLEGNFKYDGIISEEDKAESYKERQKWSDYFIIDPLDGTKEFIKNKDDFTINIAFIKNRKFYFSVVSCPKKNLIYYALKGEGAFLNGKKIFCKPSANNSVNLVASSSHLNSETEEFINKLKKKYEINMFSYGSSLKICKVAEGVVNIYPRLAPTMEWDTAAAQFILEESGGYMFNPLSEKKLEYNKQNLLNPEFIAMDSNYEI